MLRLAWYIRKHKIELIHTSDRPRDAAVCVLLARVTSAQCIVHVHVGFNPDWMRRSLQRAIHSADARIAISDFVAQTLRDAGCDLSSTYVVLNGIELARWDPGTAARAFDEELGIDDNTPVVLAVCRLFRSKGVSELLQAMHDVSDDGSLGRAPRRRRGDGGGLPRRAQSSRPRPTTWVTECSSSDFATMCRR